MKIGSHGHVMNNYNKYFEAHIG